MGEPVLIKDLAEQVIRFSGFVPDDDIKIEYIGLRPGERLEEKLIADDEVLEGTSFPRINRLVRKSGRFDLDSTIAALRPVCSPDPKRPAEYRNRRTLRAALRKFVPTVEEMPDEPEY